jgi:hypothetical protein
MNYSEIINALNTASGFDLFRIKSAIDRMLDDPKSIAEIKQHLRIGQEIQYFDPGENRIIRATITAFKRTRVAVQHIEDSARWNIPYYYINIHEINTDITSTDKKSGLQRNEVKVGDKVGFLDRNNIEQYGDVIRLNPKTVTMQCRTGQWRVAYSFLFKVINPDIDALPNSIKDQ